MEGDTGNVPAHVLIQHQNGTELIALGQISPQRFAIWKSVKVDHKNLNLKAYTPSNVSCHWLFLLTIRSRQLESAFVVATMKPDVWRGTGSMLARALMQRKNGTKSIARHRTTLKMISAYFDVFYAFHFGAELVFGFQDVS